MAITVAANNGMAVEEQDRRIATRLRIPRCMFTSAESDTTMALSTSMPIAMMIAASDMRCRAMPCMCITISVAKMEKTSPLPIRMPFFTPMKKSSTATTVMTEMIRFRIKPRLATADSYPWS